MRYYIADCHFYHKNLLTEMDNRDFKSVEQMNEVMIEKWNKKVHARDEVVILGDLSLGNGQETNEILCRLKGRLYLIRGNHDERYLRDKDFDASRFEWVKDYAEIHDNKRKIVLMHYPIFCYNGQFRRGADGTPLTYMGTSINQRIRSWWTDFVKRPEPRGGSRLIKRKLCRCRVR